MPLRLDLLRHGEALPAGNNGDAARPLSPAGRQAVAQVAREFARRSWRPDRIYSSPLRRAQETAAILFESVAPGRDPEILDELMPDGEPAAILAALAGLAAAGHLVLVGHQPLLGRLVGHLAGGPDRPLAPATLVWVECRELGPRGVGRVELELRPGVPPGRAGC